MIGLEGETTPPACAIALTVEVRLGGKGLVDLDATNWKSPKLVCANALATPKSERELVAVDFAWAALPLMV
jgi:hypothetical protein